jgi:hypothetical protein
VRLYITAGILAAILATAGGLFWAGNYMARQNAKADRLQDTLATVERATNADTSKGDADADLNWLRGASERLRGGR